MSTNQATSPATAPTGAPETELVFDDVAAQTDRELAKLKEELDIHGATPDARHKEIEKVEAFFREKKDTIKNITRAEIDNIKNAIHDENDEMEGQLQVTETGNIELKNSTDTPAEAPPTGSPGPAEEVIMPADPETKNFFEQISQKQTDNGGNGMRSLFINFLKGLTSMPFIGGAINKLVLRMEGFSGVEDKQITLDVMASIQTAMKDMGLGKTAQKLGELSPSDMREIRDAILQYPDFYDSNTGLVETFTINKYFKEILANHSIDNYKKASLKDTLLSIIQNHQPNIVPSTQKDTTSKPESTENPAPIIAIETTETPQPTEEEAEAQALRSAQEIDTEKTEAAAALAREEAIPDNPDAINTARERLNSAEKEVKESIDGQKKILEENLASIDTELKDITEIRIPMAQRALTEAESNLSRDPTNTELQAKKIEAEKNLSTLKMVAGNMKNALTDIRENLMKKFENPGVTTALEANQLSAEIKNKLKIAQGSIETEVVKTEREKTEAEKEAEKEKEKIQKEKEKLFGIYKKIKESKDGYYHDDEENLVYIIDEKGNLFKYEYNGGWIDGLWNWAVSARDDNLPYDTALYGNEIEQYNPDGTWLPTQQKAKNVLRTWDESKWRSQTTRVRMKNDAPDTPDWYNS